MKKMTSRLATAVTLSIPCLAFAGDVVQTIPLGRSLSASLPEALGGTLPIEFGGIAAVSALALLIGAQIIKRKK